MGKSAQLPELTIRPELAAECERAWSERMALKLRWAEYPAYYELAREWMWSAAQCEEYFGLWQRQNRSGRGWRKTA